MNRYTSICSLAIVLAILCSAAAAQTGRTGNRRTATTPPRVAQITTAKRPPLDFGTLTSASYANKFFGIEIPISKDWFVHDQATSDAMTEKGKEILQRDDPKQQAELDAAMNRTFSLLTMSRLPGASGQEPHALFQCVAEWVPPSYGIKTGNQYLFMLTNMLTRANLGYEVVENVQQQTIGGVQFSTITFKQTVPTAPAAVVRQKYYVTTKGGYFLGLITTSLSEEDSRAVEEVIKSVKSTSGR